MDKIIDYLNNKWMFHDCDNLINVLEKLGLKEEELNIETKDNEGKCIVSFSWFDFGLGNDWVVDTDYFDFTIVYGCSDYFYGLAHTEHAWVLSR